MDLQFLPWGLYLPRVSFVWEKWHFLLHSTKVCIIYARLYVSLLVVCYLLAFPQYFFNVLCYLFVGFIFYINQNLFSIVCQEKLIMYQIIPLPHAYRLERL